MIINQNTKLKKYDPYKKNNYNNSLHQNGKGWAWENKFIAINKYRYKPIQNFVFK